MPNIVISAGSVARFIKIAALLLVSITVAIVVTLQVNRFLHIFGKLGDHAGILLTQEEILVGKLATKEALIPKIIHQIYFNWTDPSNGDPPAEWAAARQSCIDFNPDWENKLWTETEGRLFLDEEYPWILPLYNSLKFSVQKNDVLRYFFILHYGGIYIDMDNGCTASLEPLRHYPLFVTDGGRGTLSNNILGAMPHHRFWKELTYALDDYNYYYPLPYLTISLATGQWMETDVWEQYHRRHPLEEDKLFRVLSDGREDAPPRVFFSETHGESWNNWDNEMFRWIGTHLGYVIGAPTLLGVAILVLCIWACRRRRKKLQDRGNYAAVNQEIEL